MTALHSFRHLLLAIPACMALHAGTSHAQATINEGADLFINATLIAGNGLSFPTNLFSKGKEVGEPEHAPTGTSAGKSAWWKWTAPQSGWCTVDTLDLDPNAPIKGSVLAVYTGSNVSDLTAIGKNDDAFFPNISTPYSRLTFRAVAGVTYSIAVDGKSVTDIVNPSAIYASLSLVFMPDAAFQAVGVFLDELTLDNALLTVSKTASNSFSGRLSYRNKSYPVRGQHDLSGRATVVIPIKNDPVPVILHLNFAGPPTTIYLEKGPEIIPGSLIQAVTRTSLDAAFLGRGTMAVGNASPGEPYGYGCGSYLLSRSGTFTTAFILPDGTAFTGSGRVLLSDAPGDVVCYLTKPLHQNRGSVLMGFSVTTTLPYGICFALYERPAKPTSNFYPAGFKASLQGLTNAYSKPVAGRFAGALNASGGDGVLKLEPSTAAADPFPGLSTGLNLSLQNKFSFTDASLKPKLSFNLNTGLISGQIRPDPTKPAIPIRGVALTFTGAPGTHFLGHYRTPISTDRMLIEPPP